MFKKYLVDRIDYKSHYIFYGLILFPLALFVAWFVRPEIILLWNILFPFSIIYIEFYARDTLGYNINFKKLYLEGVLNLLLSNIVSILLYSWTLASSSPYFDLNYKYTYLTFVIISIVLSIIFFIDGVFIFKYARVDKGYYVWATLNSFICFIIFLLLGNPIVG